MASGKLANAGKSGMKLCFYSCHLVFFKSSLAAFLKAGHTEKHCLTDLCAAACNKAPAMI